MNGAVANGNCSTLDIMYRHRDRGFTLVEIMIVVVIIGLLAAMAVPAFIKVRENSWTSTCINNLRQIAYAKDNYLLEGGFSTESEIEMDDLVGHENYIRAHPICPLGGEYIIGPSDDPPTCSIDGHEL